MIRITRVSSRAVKGTYYLPYQLYYSPEQLRSAYPEIDDFFATKNCLIEVFALSLAKIICVFDRLFKPCNFGTNFVITTLNDIEFIRTLGLEHTSCFE